LIEIPLRTFATASHASTAASSVSSVLPADQHHRVDRVREQARHCRALEPVGLVLQAVDLDQVG
jgi:hypothetical protein